MGKRANWPIFSFDVLLGAILVLILATPFLERQDHPILPLLLGFVLFAGAYCTSYKRWHLVISAVLGVPWLVLTILGALESKDHLAIYALTFFVLFGIYTVVVILSHVARTKTVTRTLIAAGVSVYFLMAITFAVLFGVLQLITPGAIHFPEGDAATFSSFLYFSIASITTVGYGEVYPVTPLARILAVMEAAIGFLFIGVFIARLISQFKPREG